jgi:hypothetical protein
VCFNPSVPILTLGLRKVVGAEVVARDGYPQHSTPFSIPLTDVYLDPRLDMR